ncbi:MAG: hypothetical protein AAGB46_16660 [Verrucomicrobiota bacterium]
MTLPKIVDRWISDDLPNLPHLRIWEPDTNGEALPEHSPRASGNLKIRYFCDAHGALFPHEKDSSSLFEFLKAKNDADPETSLLLGGGDDHGGGSPWDVFMAEKPARSFAYRLLEEVGISAFTLGNHDLDWGIDALVSALSDSQLRPIVTNARSGSPIEKVTVPARIFEFENCRLGVLGLANLANVIDGEDFLTDPLSAAKPWLSWMQGKVDCIVVISHMGNLQETSSDDLALLPELSPNTLLLGSHTHQLIPEVSDEWRQSNYLQSGLLAKNYGEAFWSSDKGWFVKNQTFAPQTKQGPSRARPRFEKELSNILDTRGKRSIAAQPNPQVDQSIPQDEILDWASEQYANWARVNADESETPLMACLCSRFKSKESLPPSASIKDWYRVFQYADRMVNFTIPWKHVPEWLAFNADRLAQAELNPKKDGFLFYDPNWQISYRTEGSKVGIASIEYQGMPFEPHQYQVLKIHTHAFVASGAGGYGPYIKKSRAAAESLQINPTSLREFLWESSDPD